MRFDLETLAEPIENLRPELEAAYESLDAEWKQVTAKLKSLPIPCRVSLPIPSWNEDSETSLEWRRFKGSWRFCVVNKRPAKAGSESGENVTVKPFGQWTAQERLNHLRRIPEFFEEATKQTRQFIKRATNASAAA